MQSTSEKSVYSDSSTGPIPIDGPGSISRALPQSRLATLSGFGRSSTVASYVWRPSTLDQLRALILKAETNALPLTLRGSGRSYGDAATNAESMVVDLRRLNRVLAWDPDTGEISLEPGVTIEQLWRTTIEDGWWPPVVPGTMAPTIGGCLAMNIHGKNGRQVGVLGDHVTSIDLMISSGEVRTCSLTENSDLFRGAIGGFGLLGAIVRVTIQMKRIFSGRLEVRAEPTPTLDAMLDAIDEKSTRTDYVVGWVDGFARGSRLGRGVLHEARHLSEGEDPDSTKTLGMEFQTLPSTILGVIPKSVVGPMMRPFLMRPGIRFLNGLKYRASRLFDKGIPFSQSHAAFAFLLDYVPGWQKAYGPSGLVQYQLFLPKATASTIFRFVLEETKKAGLPSFLAVVKRHRADEFLISHGVDGFSLALDFKVDRRFRKKGPALFDRLTEEIVDAGGRFYLAKDSILSSSAARRYLGNDTLATFAALKSQVDPRGIFESDLARRLFGASNNGPTTIFEPPSIDNQGTS